MEKLSFQEISSILNSDIFTDHDCGPNQWMNDNIFTPGNPETIDDEFNEQFQKLGNFKCISKYGGEGFGDEFWAVYHFIDHDLFIKFDGWYQSYSGSEYNEMIEVRPKERVITVYE